MLTSLRSTVWSRSWRTLPYLKLQQFSNESVNTTPKPSVNTTREYIQECEKAVRVYSQYVDDVVNRWKRNDEIYYGKDRDFVNYPPIKKPDMCPLTRLGFIPDSFFHPFYNKTGVTGPYLFMFSVGAALCSKELYLINGETVEILLAVVGINFLVWLFRPTYENYMKHFVKTTNHKMYYEPMAQIRGYTVDNINTAKTEMARAAAIPMLIKLKEEHVGLQLEMAYRQRLQKVYHAVTHQLNYLAEHSDTQKRYQQRHMVKWVVNQVVSGITPSQQKETILQCISELRRMAQAQKMSAASA